VNNVGILADILAKPGVLQPGTTAASHTDTMSLLELIKGVGGAPGRCDHSRYPPAHCHSPLPGTRQYIPLDDLANMQVDKGIAKQLMSSLGNWERAQARHLCWAAVGFDAGISQKLALLTAPARVTRDLHQRHPQQHPPWSLESAKLEWAVKKMAGGGESDYLPRFPPSNVKPRRWGSTPANLTARQATEAAKRIAAVYGPRASGDGRVGTGLVRAA